MGIKVTTRKRAEMGNTKNKIDPGWSLRAFMIFKV